MFRLRKRISLIVLILVAIIALAGCGSSKYAARVNNSYITKAQYQQAVDEVINYYAINARKLTPTEQTSLKKETLGRLINEELIRQAAALKGIPGPKKQVDDYIKSLKKSVDDPKKFQELLKDRAYSENDYRQRLWMKFTTKALSDEVTKNISDPLAKKHAFDKYLAEWKSSASIKIYEKF